jgi:hypothetical protein
LNAYFFGRHEGELPQHLLREAGAEHGIWAIGALAGDEHNVFYAAALPESAAMQEVTGAIDGAGTNVVDTLMECVSDDCKQMVMAILGVVAPCHIPGPPEWILFLIIEGREQLRHLEQALERLGDGNVAAAYDGHGRFLVELASDDGDLLDDVARSFGQLEQHRVLSTHRLRGQDLQRA